jgi:Nucleotidyl transferase AbiEii toxin, Type IV TA system
MFEESVLDTRARRLLRMLGSLLCPRGFFLVGGTALALHCGHRKSDDLDFFTREPFDVDRLLGDLEAALKNELIRVIGRANNTLNLAINGIRVDVIRYRYHLLRPTIREESWDRLDVPDIAAMKLAAIAARGSKKDFIDLYFILRQFSLDEVVGFYEAKFPGHESFHVIKSLTWFDDAEREPGPIMLEPVEWAGVKETIRAAVRRLE